MPKHATTYREYMLSTALLHYNINTSVLDVNVLTIAIHWRCDDDGDEPLFTPAEYRRAAYRQYFIWQHAYLGRGHCKVISLCVAWAVTSRYPAPDGQYLGFNFVSRHLLSL